MAVSPENATPLKADLRDRSRFGPFDLWVNESCSHEMYAIDIDKLTYKMRSGILRIWESKMPSERISDGEGVVLPLLAKLIGLGIFSRVLRPGSGVFVVRGLPPYRDGADVTSIPSGRVVRVSAEALIRMFDCEA